MFKASELVAFCLSMVGMPYWYGTCVYNCTSSLHKRKSKQYPTHYKSGRTARYNSDISKKLVCTDCVGMIKGFFWTGGGVGVKEAIGTGQAIKSKYGGNGCPDKSATGMLTWCKSKGAKNGAIATLPDVPGILLFSPGHVGVYIGGGYAVEARGFNYGVVKTKVSERGWKNWSYMPSSVLTYDTIGGVQAETPDSEKEDIVAPTPIVDNIESVEKVYKLGDRLIKRGVKGTDVEELQRHLVQLGYDLGKYGVNKDGIDGDFGTKSVNALKKFQEVNGLVVDGKYGEKSHAKLMEIITSRTDTFQIKVTGNKVNVRTKPNTSTGDIMYRKNKGDTLTSIGVDEETGWYKLNDGYYISNQYAVKDE